MSLENMIIDRLLGSSPFSEVRLLRWEDHEFALKRLIENHPDHVQMLEQEFRCLEGLTHPHIIPVYKWLSNDSTTAFIMKALHGVNGKVLAERLQRLPPTERHRKVIQLGIQLCSAVEYVHQHGWLHRDIKPTNLMIEQDNHLVLIDFGTAIPFPSQASSKGLVGTPRYASPEQITGLNLSEQSDQFSIGATLYFLLLNQAPFSNRDRSSFIEPTLVDPSIPSRLESILLRMLSTDPSDRFSTLTEVIEQLHQVHTIGQPLAGREDLIKQIATCLRRIQQGEQIHVHIEGTRGSGKTWIYETLINAAKRQRIQQISYPATLELEQILDVIGERSPLLVCTTHPCSQRFGIPTITIDVPWLSLAHVRRSLFSYASQTPNMALLSEKLHQYTNGLPALLLPLLEQYTENGVFEMPTEVDLFPEWFENLTEKEIQCLQLLSISQESLGSEVIEMMISSTDRILANLQENSLVSRQSNGWIIANEWTRQSIRLRYPLSQIQEREWQNTLEILPSKNSTSHIEDIELLSATGKLAEAKELGEQLSVQVHDIDKARCLLYLGQVYLDIGMNEQAVTILADATALSHARKDHETYFRSQALRARVALEMHHSSPTGGMHALDRLSSLLPSTNPWILSIWQWALGSLGDHRQWNKHLAQALQLIEEMDSTKPIEQFRCTFNLLRGACALGELKWAEDLIHQKLPHVHAYPLLEWELQRVRSLIHQEPPPATGSLAYNLHPEELLLLKRRWIRVKGKHPDPTWHH